MIVDQQTKDPHVRTYSNSIAIETWSHWLIETENRRHQKLGTRRGRIAVEFVEQNAQNITVAICFVSLNDRFQVLNVVKIFVPSCA